MRMLSKSSDVIKYIIVCSFAFFLNAGTIAQQDQSLQHWLSVVEKSPDNAIAWFNIGVLYETGQDTQKNLTQAHDAYKKAIELDYAPAMYNLGSIYAKQKDYANARLWWEKAAELDLPEAQYNMGMLYEKGWGVNIDPQLSSSWYQRAAETAMEKYFQLYQKSRSEHPGSSVADEISLNVFDRLVFINTASAASSDSYVSAAEPEESDNLQLAQADTSNSNDSNGDEQGRPPGWDWVYSQPQENFTIQLFATKAHEKTGKFIQQYALSEGAKVIQAVVKGTTYYKVLIGSFGEWNDAAVEIGTFPQDLRNQRPWVRKFGSLYKELPKGTVVEQNSQPESQQAQEADKNTANTESADSNEFQNTEISSQTTETDQAASQNQATNEQNADVTEPPVSTQAEKILPKTAQSAESIDSKDETKPLEEEPTLQAESDNQDVQTPSSTQEDTLEEKSTAALELPQTDEVFTIYTKKQLASKAINAELKSQLKSGLEAIQAGDHSSGYSLLTNLAESGLAEAQYRVALLYSQGKGVEKDDVKAFALMKSASEQGHPYAQQSLAEFYVNGTGVEANSSLATYWQQTAADNVNKLENQ